jgi:hypothetical protein
MRLENMGIQILSTSFQCPSMEQWNIEGKLDNSIKNGT